VQALRRTLGWFLVAVAVLVPLKVTLATASMQAVLLESSRMPNVKCDSTPTTMA
jgi:hypothetical protein